MPIKKLIALSALAFCAMGFAQDYPSRPITLVVPVPAGGATDAVARAMADEMGKHLGQPVVVDNRPGASGMLGTQIVARAKPDGYTLLLTVSASILNAPYIYAKVPYDVKRDLSFVTQVASASMVLAVNKDVPASNMKEFLAWAAAHKGKVNYGSFGLGTAGHLVSAYLNDSRKLDMSHVAYKGEAPMVQDLLGGQINWGVGSVGAMGPHIAGGRLRALAVFGDERLPDLPDVPTVVELGLRDPEFKPLGWMVMMAPAGVPAPIAERIETEARRAVHSTPLKARFQAYGLKGMGTSSAEFRREFDEAAPLIERLVKLSGAKQD